MSRIRFRIIETIGFEIFEIRNILVILYIVKLSCLIRLWIIYLQLTIISSWVYRFSFDHRSQATLSVVSTWMGDRLGMPRIVNFQIFFSLNYYFFILFRYQYSLIFFVDRTRWFLWIFPCWTRIQKQNLYILYIYII